MTKSATRKPRRPPSKTCIETTTLAGQAYLAVLVIEGIRVAERVYLGAEPDPERLIHNKTFNIVALGGYAEAPEYTRLMLASIAMIHFRRGREPFQHVLDAVSERLPSQSPSADH